MSRHRVQRQLAAGWESPLVLRVVRGSVAVALVASGVVACATTNAPPTPRTAPVELTSITSGVAATGALTPLTEQNIGFTTGGQLTAVNVKVGDRVTAGQILAQIDPFSAQQSFNQAQAQLNGQRAGLTKVTDSPVVSGAQATLDQAREILRRTEDQADATQSADQTAIDNAERELSQAKKVLDKAQDQLRRDQDACDSTPASSGSSGTTTTATMAPTAAPTATRSPHSGSSGSGSSALGATGSTSVVVAMMAMVSSTSTTPGTCTAVPADKQAVTTAKSAVVADQGAVDAAEAKKDVDNQSGQLAVANAEQQVVSAQNSLNSAASDRPSDIAAQAAQVAAAQAQANAAQRGVDDTTLRAPVDGVVSALNGAVGEFVAPSSNTSALAPGTDASLPGTNGVSAASAASAAVATPGRPGGTQFLVLDGINAFQAVLAFTETDAATITPGQKVNLTFDAVPDLALSGSVLSVSPSGTAISGVISYYVTVAVPTSDPRLRSGMTAQAEVITKEIPNVLAVPSGAVHRQNGIATVTVVDPGNAQRPVTVQTGATGDGKTQVLSGLKEGQVVVLPVAP
jgi:HlyD family secretion protein